MTSHRGIKSFETKQSFDSFEIPIENKVYTSSDVSSSFLQRKLEDVPLYLI